jgi:hypothetical protein
MIRWILLLLAIPIGGILAQGVAPAIHVLISSPNHAPFRVSRSPQDSTLGPLIARGQFELVVDQDVRRRIEAATLDTVNKVHIDAIRDGRVIASADGAYLTVHRDLSGVVIDARSQVPASVAPPIRRP